MTETPQGEKDEWHGDIIAWLENRVEDWRIKAADPRDTFLPEDRKVFAYQANNFAKAAAEIKSLRAKLAEAEGKIAEQSKLIYVPGAWHCPKCKFRLFQSNLNMGDGSVTARDEPGDKCPNCDGPLWRVAERDDRRDAQTSFNEQFDKLQAAESTISAQAAVIETLREALEKIAALRGNPLDTRTAVLILADARRLASIALSTLPSASIERMAKEKKVVEAATEIDSYRLVIEAAVRRADPANHAAVVAAIFRTGFYVFYTRRHARAANRHGKPEPIYRVSVRELPPKSKRRGK